MSIVSRRTRKAPARLLEFYGEGIPYLKDVDIRGRLIVIEGPDGSGRSTQIDLIISKLEADGHGVLNTGLKRSDLIKEGILQAKQMLPLGKRTLALFYAADFADQLEHKIIPALEAGEIVLADRYIFTYQQRMAREFATLANKYGLVRIDGNRPIPEVHIDLQERIDRYLASI